ncbi:hypothetical protein J7T55_010110 [Diaporthe amygdali]|uniref:uncharacterized protein n=1 Tax=Phomopsis amygdali TaxID=1214568 RepID=UPI0022FE4796|nr:uncharacterized protein J7T55_010110 [Diaporthe amygdali]KAJ0113866.1 hypothetical protein J7T55_010110 [Diaporthe amygdali]
MVKTMTMSMTMTMTTGPATAWPRLQYLRWMDQTGQTNTKTLLYRAQGRAEVRYAVPVLVPGQGCLVMYCSSRSRISVDEDEDEDLSPIAIPIPPLHESKCSPFLPGLATF